MSETKTVTFYPPIDWMGHDNGDGPEIETEIRGRASVTVDRNYGADADGNRGESQTFVDDIEVIEASIKLPGREWIKIQDPHNTLRTVLCQSEFNSLMDDINEKIWEV